MIFLKLIIVFTGDRQADRQTDRQTDTGVKTKFSHSRDLRMWRFDKNFESNFSHKINTFSYDDNLIIKERLLKTKESNLHKRCNALKTYRKRLS